MKEYFNLTKISVVVLLFLFTTIVAYGETECGTVDFIPPDKKLAQVFHQLGGDDPDGPFTHVVLRETTDPRVYARACRLNVNEDEQQMVGDVVVNASRVSLLDYNQLLFVVGHELGHMDYNLVVAQHPSNEEGACDMYSLISLIELKEKGVKIDLFDAISIVQTFNEHPEPGDPHPPASVRYKALYDQLVKLGYHP